MELFSGQVGDRMLKISRTEDGDFEYETTQKDDFYGKVIQQGGDTMVMPPSERGRLIGEIVENMAQLRKELLSGAEFSPEEVECVLSICMAKCSSIKDV